MRRLLCIAGAAVLLVAAGPASAVIAFDFSGMGTVAALDCPPPLPSQPLCVDINGPGVANDVPDAIPGSWLTSLVGRILFFAGSGTFYYDDPSAANNDFFGTWQDVLGAPDASGIAQASFTYQVLGGSGIFAGASGTGTSIVDVVVAPAGFDNAGLPIFAAACAGGPSGIGAYCENGHFAIDEPGMLELVSLTLVAGALSRRLRKS